jgi:hypothetical protein
MPVHPSRGPTAHRLGPCPTSGPSRHVGAPSLPWANVAARGRNRSSISSGGGPLAAQGELVGRQGEWRR